LDLIEMKEALSTVSGPLQLSECFCSFENLNYNFVSHCLCNWKLSFAWCREAQIIGDFNGWDGSNHRMEKNEFGVWSIKIPDSGGNPVIPHNSRVKFRFMQGNGVWVDRIPAWIKYATVDPASFGAPYDGVYWDPPTSERYQLLVFGIPYYSCMLNLLDAINPNYGLLHFPIIIQL
jgi:hypothetical protein